MDVSLERIVFVCGERPYVTPIKFACVSSREGLPTFYSFHVESRAIARYVSLKYEAQGSPLYGRTLKERAHVDQWLEVESQNFHIAASALVYQLGSRPKKGELPDEVIVQENVKKLEKVLDVYEAQLTNFPFLAGDFFSLADLSHLPRTTSLLSPKVNQAHLFTSRQHVLDWWNRISSRPSWLEVQELAKSS